MMKPRDRIRTALNHEEPDRCPMQITFTPEFANRLRGEMGLESDLSSNDGAYDLERALGVDMLLTSVGWSSGYYQSADSYTDEWGVGWQSTQYSTPYGMGRYTEICGHPLADANHLSSYRAPDPSRPTLYREADQVIHTFKDDYWIVGATVTTIFEAAWALRGYEQLLTDFALDPDLAEAILDIPFEYHLAAARELTRRGVDMIWIGDDVGAQDKMIMSPKMWRRFLKPRMAAFIEEIKRINPNLKVAYHSDGMITPILPDLVEIGLDVLNPVQPASMDPAMLKRDYGEHLCFWGSIDEQHTLPFGSPEDVCGEVLSRLETLGKGGGLIIGPTHHVQLDTPMENFWAMVHTIRNTPY